MSEKATIGRTIRCGGGEMKRRRAIRVVSAALSPAVLARTTCISARLHGLDDPTQSIPFAGDLHDRAGDDDVRPSVGRGLRRLGGADAPADDDGNLDRLPDRADQSIRHRFRGPAARLEGEGGGLGRGLLVRVEQGHVEGSLLSPLQNRLVHVHASAPARKAARATIIPYFATRWDRAGFLAEWRAA